MFEDGLNEEVVSLFGAVAAECVGVCHFVHGTVHGFDACHGQRTGHVAYPQPDEFLSGVCSLENIDFLCDVGKQVASGKFQVMFVY